MLMLVQLTNKLLRLLPKLLKSLLLLPPLKVTGTQLDSKANTLIPRLLLR